MKLMPWLRPAALGCLALFLLLAADSDSSLPSIVRLDPRLDAIIPRDAAIEKIAGGFTWTEGPVWNRASGSLLFSDVPNNVIREWKPGRRVEDFLKPSGYLGAAPFSGREPGSNGLTFDSQGRLVFAQHGERAISRREKDGSITRLIDRYQGKRLNSPNDLVFRSNGDLYFTDPPFGLPKAFDDPAKELDFQGVYRLTPAGELTLLTAEVGAPNGIAFSPDESTLYVSDSKNAKWLAFPVKADGTLGPSRLLLDGAEFKKTRPGVPDGLKIDERGNIFGAGPGGIYVIAPGGALLGWFNFGVPTGNCAWGEDGSALFVTSNTAVYRIRTNTRGVRYGATLTATDAREALTKFNTLLNQPGNDWLVAVTFITGPPGTGEQMRNELLAIEAATRAEPGNIAYDLFQSPERPHEFMRFEVWRTPEDLELHKQTPHLKAFFERRKEWGWTTQITRWQARPF